MESRIPNVEGGGKPNETKQNQLKPKAELKERLGCWFYVLGTCYFGVQIIDKVLTHVIFGSIVLMSA
jgi:hypothetical protein